MNCRDVNHIWTPPPVGEISLPEVRKAWGRDTVIWINFPETIFYSGADVTYQYTVDLLKGDSPGDSLILGYTEMGLWGATNEVTETTFKNGTLAIMDAIENIGKLPIQP